MDNTSRKNNTEMESPFRIFKKGGETLTHNIRRSKCHMQCNIQSRPGVQAMIEALKTNKKTSKQNK